MEEEKVRERIDWLMEEIAPVMQHADIDVIPRCYNIDLDTLYLDVSPGSGPEWASTAYEFAKHEGMKYDREPGDYGIDGQPRVSYSGLVYARYVGPFLDGSRVGFNIWSQQPSHRDAEEQLMRFYGLFRERDGLEPLEVFRKYL